MNEFDEWQKMVFDFTMKKGRPFTASEWQVMRHCFEVRKFLAKRPEEQRLAADATTVAEILEEASNQTAVSNFVSDDGTLRMSVTLRFVPGGSAEVYLKLSDDDVRSADGGYVRFAEGDDARIKLDSRGRARIPCAEYIALLERAASIRCAGTDGVERTMETE